MARASEWRKRIAEWRASGLSAAKFAESRGCSAHQVWNWAAKFRKEDAAHTAETAAEVQVGRAVAHNIPLARVLRVPRQDSTEKPTATAMAVEVGGMRLVVPSGYDRGTLAMVLDEVQGRKPRLGAG